jgi:putative transposase
MGQKRHKPEEIVAKLRQVEVLTGQGRSIAEAARSIGVSEQTYFRWRAEYGGMKVDQLKRLKELELENKRLRQAVSDLTLDKQILAEAARGNFYAPPVAAPAWDKYRQASASRSAVRARCWDSTAPRSAKHHTGPMTRRR